MNTPIYIVNLDLPPAQRWTFLAEHTDEINELLGFYLNDFAEASPIFENIALYKDAIIPQHYQEELASIAAISNFTADEVLIANLYYDILKFYLGCTAFVAAKEGQILHARNLDWHTDNNMLSRYSCIFDYQKGGQTIFKTVGWLGFIGVLSGIKLQRFSLTFNSILSYDMPEIAYPVSFLLRDVLENALTFQTAKTQLETTTIASDCLLLLSGIKPNEKVVIERTPTRFVTRTTKDNYIVVTNDYKELENAKQENSLLQSTSCRRFDQTIYRLKKQLPLDTATCLSILKDEKIQMGITVQQMVFDNLSGEISLIRVGVD